MTSRTHLEAARAWLAALGLDPDADPLAPDLLELARRLDSGPPDAMFVSLSRELRLVSAAIRDRHDGRGADEVESFLERIARTDGGDASDGR